MRKNSSDSASALGRSGRLQVAPSPWRTIDSAPKDGTLLLTGFRDDGNRWTSVGCWRDCVNNKPGWTDYTVQSWGYEEWTELNPTHWMPLPDGPTAQDETGGDATRSEAPSVIRDEVAKIIDPREFVWEGYDFPRDRNARARALAKADQIIALIKAPPERDQFREELKPLSSETSALLAEAEQHIVIFDAADANECAAYELQPGSTSHGIAATVIRRLAQALREARG